jgi:hypothetical protein
LDDAHDKLNEWFMERTKTGAILNRTVLARKLYVIINPKANPTPRELNNYLFRVDHWRKKRGVVNRCVTHVSQKVEKDQLIMDDWVTMVNGTIKAHGIQPHCIVSMDEMNCYFDQSKKIGSQLAYIGCKEVRRCERVEFLLYMHSHCTRLFYTGKLKESGTSIEELAVKNKTNLEPEVAGPACTTEPGMARRSPTDSMELLRV